MTEQDESIAMGNWGKNVSWELYEASDIPPVELCTAVMCVAIANEKIVLACSDRGWGMLGGHIEDGETLDMALHREAFEEGGFIIQQYELLQFVKSMLEFRCPSGQGKTTPSQ